MSSKNQAEDPDDYVTSRRLEDIYNARRGVLEANKEATRLRIKGQEIASQQIYREAVKGYLLELQSLLFEFGEEDLWYSRSFGDIPVEPPNSELESPNNLVPHMYHMEHKGEKIVIEEPLPSTEQYEIVGFSTLVTEDSPLTASFEYNVYNKLRDSVVREREFFIPISALDQMVISANNFLAEYGLDIGSEDELPTHNHD